MKLFCVLLAALVLSGCCADLNKDKIKNELAKNLQVGDSREKAERVLKSHGIYFSYDEYSQRYQSNITGKNCAFDKSVIVYIYIGESGGVSRIETSYAYTFL